MNLKETLNNIISKLKGILEKPAVKAAVDKAAPAAKKAAGVVGKGIDKLPFVKLAGNIPEGARAKIPFLNALIPFANHIASGAAIVVLVAALGGGGGEGGGLAGTRWEFSNDRFRQTLSFGRTEYVKTESHWNDEWVDSRSQKYHEGHWTGAFTTKGKYKVIGDVVTLYDGDSDSVYERHTLDELTIGYFQRVR